VDWRKRALDAEADTHAGVSLLTTYMDRLNDADAEIARLRDTIAQVRAHELTAPHGRDCLAHVHGGKYCNCGVTLWQEGYDAALEAVAGILGEVAK
jgi:hypothetical protein